ncbi:aldose 1-epimerase [Rhizobiaceae bacterium n13]|uniref:Aldose 1-epimerase n=1 Tax=Ferirhizobium litorale TaxID=2927786 RepID=A0AAE3QI02_9HYPH|nr:aldose 1-epimerase [Fererhizobium litorale]MDI7864124.1 aldose 1-epimerase [Fererhizobium litorale]MDI7923736.1 aldose 1-epimerase [Fererhizobium litorale]
MDPDVLHLQNGNLSVEVSRFGGSLLSGHYRGIPFLKPTPTAGIASQRHGVEAGFPLVPYGNRIEANTFEFAGKRFAMPPNTADPFCLHGDGWLAEWEVISQAGNEAVLRHVHRTEPPNPYAYETIQTVRLDDDGLALSLSVTNKSDAALPYGLGFHPFFPRTQQMRLQAQAGRYWTEREGHLPDLPVAVPEGLDFTASKPLPRHWINNVYDGWNGKAWMEWPEYGLSLSLTADGIFRCFMIYAPDTDASFFCFEPMSHLPNAHNMLPSGGLVTLMPEQSLAGSMRLHPAALPAPHQRP